MERFLGVLRCAALVVLAAAKPITTYAATEIEHWPYDGCSTADVSGGRPFVATPRSCLEEKVTTMERAGESEIVPRAEAAQAHRTKTALATSGTITNLYR